MLTEYIQDHEKLYRAINLQTEMWDEDYKRPSSAAFKDKRGVSVNRQGSRTNLDSIINKLRQHYLSRLKAIVSISAGKCREINTYPKYKPNRNIYHSVIQESEHKIMISDDKAFFLSRLVRIEKLNY